MFWHKILIGRRPILKLVKVVSTVLMAMPVSVTQPSTKVRNSGHSEPNSQDGEEDFLNPRQSDPASLDPAGERRPSDLQSRGLERVGRLSAPEVFLVHGGQGLLVGIRQKGR